MTESAGQNGNADQIAYWNDTAAVTWTRFQELLDAVFTPLTALAIQAAAPAAGQRVVDVGCGCGGTVLELARRVGPGGQVLGVDVSESMAARARERVAQAGLRQARVQVSDAATHDFTGTEADLLFSRFGVMFFTDPTAAFTNMRRAMRPGGRLLFACWRPLADNSWFYVPLDAARPLLPPQPPPEPNAPGPFAFANRDRVLGILTAAAWQDAAAVAHDVPMPIAGREEIEKAVDFATRVGPLARMLVEAGPDVRTQVHAAVEAALARHAGPDGVTLGGAIWLVSARV